VSSGIANQFVYVLLPPCLH